MYNIPDTECETQQSQIQEQLKFIEPYKKNLQYKRDWLVIFDWINSSKVKSITLDPVITSLLTKKGYTIYIFTVNLYNGSKYITKINIKTIV